MARGGRELFPLDRGLQARMALAMLTGTALTAALIAAVVWWALSGEDRGWKAAIVFVIALTGFAFSLNTEVPAGDSDPERLDEAWDRLETIADRLAALADVRAPRVGVSQYEAPQCWTTAGPFGRPALVATLGLVERLSDEELEAVVAHELTHLENGDATVMTIIGGPPSWLLSGAWQMMIGAWEDRRIRALPVVAVWCPIAMLVALPGWLASRMVSRYRELAADRGAAVLTGSPAALASALRHLSGELDRIPARDLRELGGSDLFYVLPSGGEVSGLRRLWATHPPLTTRLDRLEEMERRLQSARPVLPAE
jgi:heat shock protein HtpX